MISFLHEVSVAWVSCVHRLRRAFLPAHHVHVVGTASGSRSPSEYLSSGLAHKGRASLQAAPVRGRCTLFTTRRPGVFGLLPTCCERTG